MLAKLEQAVAYPVEPQKAGKKYRVERFEEKY